MVVVNELNGVGAYRPVSKRAGSGGGFRVAEHDAAAPEATATGTVSMPSLLGLQEAQGDAVSDREARRHANEALDTLKDLQLSLLRGGKAGLDRLSRLAARMPEAADPRLRDIQSVLLQRLAVERARHGGAASL